jgi:tRNA/rRNA methyltransferase
VLATTARQRDMVKTILTPEAAAEELHARAASEQRTGILFGPERTGLMNDDIPLADAVVTIPVNPAFSSLNLAQGVLLIGYCWWRMKVRAEDRWLDIGNGRPATKVELDNLFSAWRSRWRRVVSTPPSSSARRWCATCATCCSAPR